MKKKSILLISYSLYPEIGSGANRMTNLFLQLKRKGYNVRFVTTEPNYPSRELYEQYDGHFDREHEGTIIRVQTKVKNYTTNMWRRMLFYFEVMIRLLFVVLSKESKADFVFVSSPPLFLGIVGMLHKWRFRSTFLLDVRDLWPETLKGVKKFDHSCIMLPAYGFERMLYKSAHTILYNSEGFRSYLQNKVPNKQLVFLPNSLSEDELSGTMKQVMDAAKLRVIYTGNIGLAQDLHIFVELAKELQHHTYIEFGVMGYGAAYHQFCQKVKGDGLENIVLLEPGDRSHALQAIREAHIAFVSLTEAEVFQTVIPGKVIDYMAMGKPIIGVVNGYSRSVIEEADCGIVFPNRDVKQMATAVLQLVQDGSLRHQLGENGRHYALQRYSWNRNISKLQMILEDIYEAK